MAKSNSAQKFLSSNVAESPQIDMHVKNEEVSYDDYIYPFPKVPRSPISFLCNCIKHCFRMNKKIDYCKTRNFICVCSAKNLG